MEERIQKILARAGFGSRRSCEELITAGRIRINGKPAILGSKADQAVDKIAVDGRPIPAEAAPNIYIALNKPVGVLSDEDPQDNRQSVRDLVNIPGHLFTVGRLDLESEGLILMTNDGELANRLTHPRYGHEKEYKVLVSSHPDEKQIKAWRLGVVMEDGYKTAPADVSVDKLSGKGAWMRIILREGKKRQIREVGKLIGLHVVKIQRIRIGGLMLGNLKSREWRYLTPDEVKDLTKTGAAPRRFAPRTGLKNALRRTFRKPDNAGGEKAGQVSEYKQRSSRPPYAERGEKPGNEGEQKPRSGRQPFGERSAKPGTEGEQKQRPGRPPFTERGEKKEAWKPGGVRKGPQQKRVDTGRPSRPSGLRRGPVNKKTAQH
jgi:23S rRNA pseudouridine2605 synthase